jgi:phytoene dehydrogenase-like protein
MSLATSGALTARGKLELGRVFAMLPAVDASEIQDVTLERWMSENIRESSARKAFAAFMRVSTYGNAPALMSAGAAIAQCQLGRGGVEYLDGGWQTLVEGLRTAAERAGITLHPSSRVDSVKFCRGPWQVASRNIAHYFDAVVLAAPPHDSAAMVTGEGHEALDRWAQDAAPVRAAVLDVVLSRLPNPAGGFALGFDSPTYLSAHSLTAALAPEGQTLITSAWYRDPDETIGDGDIERRLEHVLDLVQPGWRDHVTFRRFMPALTVAHDFVRASTKGTVARPGPAVPGAEGLFVAGDWVGPEGMLADAAVASGESAGVLAAAHAAAAGSTITAA